MITAHRSRRHLVGVTTVALLTVAVLAMGRVAAAQSQDPIAGEWEVTQAFGNRTFTSIVVITGRDGNYTGRVQTGRGDVELRDLKVADHTVTFARPMRRRNEQTVVKFTGKLDGQTITGAFDNRPDSPITLRRTRSAEPGPVNAESPFRLNTVGYPSNAPKLASVPLAFESFSIVDAESGRVAYTGKPTGPVLNADTNEPLYTADFTAVTSPGAYKLVIDRIGESDPFSIGDDVYDQPFTLAVRAMYLWRCGTAVRGEYNGDVFEHAACHTEDAWGDYVGLGHTRVDATGGWHDAGDYNKYVSNANVTVGVMLLAWEHFGDRLARFNLDIPESNNDLPDYLDEIKWELDWLLKMQAPDGSSYHKVSTLRFGGFIPPEDETEPRYLVSPSTTATADLAAMTAMAARSYRKYDGAYADRLLAAAERAYAFLEKHPNEIRADQSKFSTGAYASSDGDDRLWAAMELFETTGDKRYLADAEARLAERNPGVEDTFDWGNVGNLGVITYILSKRPGRDAELVKRLRGDAVASADAIVETTLAHGYARTMGTRYYWGANGSIARRAVNLHVADLIEPKPAYREAILDAANHLLGRNVYGRSFVTGLGHQPPMHPHSRRSGGDKVENPWPGYLVGGGHPRAVDWSDTEASYTTNEIAINWNAALIYCFAALVGRGE